MQVARLEAVDRILLGIAVERASLRYTSLHRSNQAAGRNERNTAILSANYVQTTHLLSQSIASCQGPNYCVVFRNTASRGWEFVGHATSFAGAPIGLCKAGNSSLEHQLLDYNDANFQENCRGNGWPEQTSWPISVQQEVETYLSHQLLCTYSTTHECAQSSNTSRRL